MQKTRGIIYAISVCKKKFRYAAIHSAKKTWLLRMSNETVFCVFIRRPAGLIAVQEV